jgi:hypothetical protein
VSTILRQPPTQSRTRLSARRPCPRVGLSRATRCRCWQRQRAGQPLLRPPVPAKTGPLPLALLQEQIQPLAHGRRRTEGTGPPCPPDCRHISRRALGHLLLATSFLASHHGLALEPESTLTGEQVAEYLLALGQ